MRLFTGLFLATSFVRLFTAAQERPAFKQDEVSLHAGKPVKGGFEKTPGEEGEKEANNNAHKLKCGAQESYGTEITGSRSDTGHFELSNTGTCDIEATVEIMHITDDSGTTEKEEHAIDIPAGAHRSITFPIAVKADDKKTFVVVRVVCKKNTKTKNPRCEFVPNLTVGKKISETPGADKDQPIKLLQPKTVTPPGTKQGGGKGSACSTPANEFVTIYTFYNTLGGDVQVTFTVVNECLCEAFIAEVSESTVTGAPGSPGKPISTKHPMPLAPKNVPAKDDTAGESGARPHSVVAKKGQAITISAGCSGNNNNTKCKGSIKDIEIHIK